LDSDEIKQYVSGANLCEQVTFAGPVYDRDQLRLFYCMADMMLFPSTFDTSGLVVKEAAACDCPSLLVQGSCAAEGTEHKVSAYLAQENAESCSQIVWEACTDRNAIAIVGQNAGRTLYLSCSDAVDRAYQRYGDVLCSWNQNVCKRTNMKVMFGSVKKRKRFQNN
jgi:glycosyltransferase involved in cell wall biosynthesis